MKRYTVLLASLMFCTAVAQQKPAEKEKQIEGVTITKTKKAVEQKADRTIFDFSEQPSLNSGTLMEGVKKLPGLIVTDVAGMMYQGKLLDVYMDGRPLNISSNELQSFLDGMPANSVERIEIITQPGAEFPATSGGAILNIITSKTAKSYLSATYSGNYTFSNYEKFRSRTNNSLSLNARNKYFGWQLNVGQNYRETLMRSKVDDLSTTETDGFRRGYFAKAAMTFDIGDDRLLLNYDIYHNNNDNNTISAGSYFQVPYTAYDDANTNSLRHEGAITYQKRFADKGKKLDLKYNITSSTSDFTQDNRNTGIRVLENSSDMNISTFKADYSQPLDILDEGKISLGGLYEYMSFDTESRGLTNLDYYRQTAASYLELQAKLGKFDFIAGTRAEDYDIGGITRYQAAVGGPVTEAALSNFRQFRLFPNASIQYNFAPRVSLNLNYNKKITLPSISALNPNNNTYQGTNAVTFGNASLLPTVYNNYEAKLSAFDYAFIGYNVSMAENQVVQVVTREQQVNPQNGLTNDYIQNTHFNVKELQIRNFNVGLPIPFMIFTKPLKEIMQFNFNPDKINFLYVYAAYQKHIIEGLDTKGFWITNLMMQLMLPKETKLTLNYFVIPPRGNYYYFEAVKPIGNNLDITLSRKFLNDRLNLSVFANDVLNGQQNGFRSIYRQPNVTLLSKSDSRSFGISVNYKIPTKNRLAKEDPNLINTDKKEDTGGLLQTP